MDDKSKKSVQKADTEKKRPKTIQPFNCINCKKEFFRYRYDRMTTLCNDCQSSLRRKPECRGRSKPKCDCCSVTFKSRYLLKKHNDLKEICLKNQCKECLKTFTSKEIYTKHINKHINKNVTYKCEVCPLKFKLKRSLQSHLTRIHKTEESAKPASQVKLKYYYYY